MVFDPENPQNMIHLAAHRRTPIDLVMKDIEREYLSGRIGITETGEIAPLDNIYEDMNHDQPADYRIASSRDIDRESHRHCRVCGCAYRTADMRAYHGDRTPCGHLL